ncbi:MAG TPA: hypothetical protein ENN07_05610 [candidate division Zixibacteria bacterium]|nr:hypothetical protein [candidate division Zixibacteria bacterium]
MRKRFYTVIQKAKIPFLWAFIIACSLALVAQRAYMIGIEERVDANKEFLVLLTNQNNEIERDIVRIIETKQLERVAEADYGLRAAKLDEVVVLAEPAIPSESGEQFSVNEFFARARRKIDGIFAGSFENNITGTGGSI